MSAFNNSVLKHNDINTKISELRLMKNSPLSSRKVFIVIEGPDDKKFYSRFFNPEKVEFFVAVSCFYVVKILEMLKSDSSFKDCLIGIKDADFDHITNKTYNCNNLFLTDCHDWELTCCTENLERTLHSEYEIDYSIPLINNAKLHLKNFSFLRLYNDIHDCSINFDAVKLSNIYSGNAPIELDPCINYVKNVANNPSLSFPLNTDIEKLSNQYSQAALNDLTQGHDLIQALQIIVRKIKSNESQGEKGLSRLFRTTFSKEEFKATNLYNDIESWSSAKSLNLFS